MHNQSDLSTRKGLGSECVRKNMKVIDSNDELTPTKKQSIKENVNNKMN